MERHIKKKKKKKTGNGNKRRTSPLPGVLRLESLHEVAEQLSHGIHDADLLEEGFHGVTDRVFRVTDLLTVILALDLLNLIILSSISSIFA